MNDSATVSRDFLNNLASQAGYASGSIHIAKNEVDSALYVWADRMPEGLIKHLRKLSDTLAVDIMEIEEKRSQAERL